MRRVPRAVRCLSNPSAAFRRLAPAAVGRPPLYHRRPLPLSPVKQLFVRVVEAFARVVHGERHVVRAVSHAERDRLARGRRGRRVLEEVAEHAREHRAVRDDARAARREL